MKYMDEFRDPVLAQRFAQAILGAATQRWVLMEVCGGQTHTLMRYGIDELVAPAGVELVHGPGCPVCVTPVSMIDKAIALAMRENVTMFSYGDMMRVPGTRTSLLHAKAEGAVVRVVYSPMQAVEFAAANPERQVVFFGIGFETTAPANAMAVWRARRLGLRNFSMLASHVLAPPAMRALLASPECRVQGFIAPGHVCTVMGMSEYEELAADFRVPVVVGGFEPMDLLESIGMLVRQLESGRAEAENQYARSVARRGNPRAQAVLGEVFEICDREWRGVGFIPASGLRLRGAYAAYDAERVHQELPEDEPSPGECISARIMQGLAKPTDCPAFGLRCTPDYPLGAPMVSSEGACAAYYQFRRHLACAGAEIT